MAKSDKTGEIGGARGEVLENGALRFERLLPGPIERVWDYLVDGDKRAKWFAGGKTELRPGGAMTLEFDNGRLSDADDPAPEKYKQYAGPMSMACEVTRCERPHYFSFQWREDDSGPSLVEIELREDGEGVRLILTHSDVGPEGLASALAGWRTCLDRLGDLLAGRTPTSFWSAHTAAEAEYEAMLGRDE